ncbi:MAG: hypothetical protein FWH18_12675 [Marinilabiliaceae bacterium]|nr:hypothetical protein [Marinilabiliaceae bacterium]
MKRVFLLSWSVILLSSCVTSKFLTSDVKSEDINEMLKFEPFSYISLIEQGNRSFYNDSLSSETKIILNESLETFREKFRFSPEEITMTDSLERIRFEQEIKILILLAERNRSIKDIQIPPLIDSLLITNGKRFGLIIVQSGFTRTKSNYGNQIAKGVGMGILTMGMYYQTPIKANSTIYAVIVDSKDKNIAFYHKNVLQDKEPTEKEIIINQIHKIFEKYFVEKR